ncbi:hypothetical protein GCM10018952_05340 [Streptosporangium vulgare]
MLMLLGIGSAEETVYRTILENPSYGVTELSLELGWPVHRIRATLDELAKLSLLRPSWEEPDVLRLVRPEVGLAALLAREEAALLAKQQEIERSRTAVAQMIAAYGDHNPARPGDGSESLVGIDTIRNRIEELVSECRQELLGFEPKSAQTAENLAASRPLDESLLDRGVAIRIVYPDSVRNDQATTGYATWLTGNGGQVRTTPGLPLRMLIFDRRAALLPTDPADSSVGAVLLHGAGVVAAPDRPVRADLGCRQPSRRGAQARREGPQRPGARGAPPALDGTDRRGGGPQARRLGAHPAARHRRADGTARRPQPLPGRIPRGRQGMAAVLPVTTLTSRPGPPSPGGDAAHGTGPGPALGSGSGSAPGSGPGSGPGLDLGSGSGSRFGPGPASGPGSGPGSGVNEVHLAAGSAEPSIGPPGL